MKDSFDFALSLVSDVARYPAFAQEEIDRQRQQILSSLKVSYDDPDYLANVVFDRLVYGFHPYGKPNSGTPESIGGSPATTSSPSIRPYFAPNNAILAIVGDITPEEAFKGARARVRELGAAPDATSVDATRRRRNRRAASSSSIGPARSQTEIRVGHLAVARKHPDYLAVDLAIEDPRRRGRATGCSACCGQNAA